MIPTIRHIATRFALILATAAVLPLIAYGIVSLLSLQRGTRDSVVAGSVNVAGRAAQEIRRYITTNAEIVKTLSADLQDTGLEPWQQDRIVKNYVLRFREFREITLFDERRTPLVTSRVGRPRVAVVDHPVATFDGVEMSAIHVDEDLLPTSVFAIRLVRLGQPSGWLVAELSLEEMWRMVDEIRLGRRGFALVVAADGTLVAHGDPDKKALVARSENLAAHHPLLAQTLARDRRIESAWTEYVDRDGIPKLAVAAGIQPLGWTVIVEQPTAEAYAGARQLTRQLIVAISAALFVMVVVGWLFGRRFIAPIFALQRATQAIAGGELATRVDVRTADELGQLGNAFNSMADRLIELQENVKRQERHAMFGRIVGGLFHDLTHPLQIIATNTTLLLRDDADLRREAQRIIQRETANVKRFVDDLRDVSKPKDLQRFAVNVNAGLADIVESMKTQAESAGVTLDVRLAAGTPVISGDWFALGRVYRNLVANAIDATPSGGRISVVTRRVASHVEIEISDTGSGIAPERLPTIFDAFVTTKKRGLGLGLAISKQIVEQLEGTIAVQSEVGRGTTFTLSFPARDDLAAAHQAAS